MAEEGRRDDEIDSHTSISVSGQEHGTECTASGDEPSLESSRSNDEVLGNDDTLDSLGVRAMEQDDLERNVVADADRAINEREFELDQKRLEKSMKQKSRYNDQILRLEEKLADRNCTLSARQKIRTEIENIRNIDLAPIEQDIVDINDRIAERARAISEMSNITDSSRRLPNETERDFLIRTGKITPFSNIIGLERQTGDDDQVSMSVEPSAIDSGKVMSHQKLRLPGLDFSSDDEVVEDERNEANLRREIAHLSKKKRQASVTQKTSSEKRARRFSDSDVDSEYGPTSGSERESEEEDFVPEMDEDEAYDSEAERAKAAALKAQEELPELDDGNEDYYEKRLNRWVSKRSGLRNRIKQEPSEDRVLEEWHKPHPKYGDMKLDGGYRLPGDIHVSLFDYQKTCVQWLWELYSQRAGGIIGDEMGLGKTIQIISFLAGLHYSGKLDKPVLIVCPATVMKQWVNEFHRWWPPLRIVILHSSGSGMTKFNEEDELDRVPSGRHGRRVDSRSSSSAMKLVNTVMTKGHVLITTYVGMQIYRDAILPKQWGYCVLDEGHKIRNPDSDISLTCKQVKTPHRIILSGTPLQNNLTELWSLFDFVFPGRLGTLPIFQNQFATPINIGGYANASNVQVQTAYKCACVLRDLINPYLLRRMKVDVAADLPKKTEQVLFCKLTQIQRKSYEEFLGSGDMKSILEGKRQVLYGVDILRKICNHPDLVARDILMKKKGYKYGSPQKSGKMQVVKALLQLWKKRKHRTLLFCQTRQMLEILELFVNSMENIKYVRMDGSTPIGNRQDLVDEFNNNSDIDLFLLTTRVGGLGVNLTGADRVIIFDPDWNPSTDVQARERAWRLGQQKEVAIYRLMTSGTIEEKIYHRQIFKQYLTNKILKDPKQRRFFKSNDLHDLFSLGSADGSGTETGSLFGGAETQIRPVRANDSSESTLKKTKSKKDSESLKRLDGVASVEKFRTGSDDEADNGSNAGDNDQDDGGDIMTSLFARSGVHSALAHDEIMNTSRPEAVLVEQEANRIAKHAARALRASRQRARTAELGTPTWTGRFGSAGKAVPRTLSSNVNSSGKERISSGSSSPAAMSSRNILSRLRRNRELEEEQQQRAKYAEHQSDIYLNDMSSDDKVDLLKRLRDYIALQGGRAKSADVVNKFSVKVSGPEQIAIFREMLKEIAVWKSDEGVWTLKDDFAY
ncbi:SNF2 family N-terminal domain-containing protein [Dipodascopsis uninucleata]